MKIYRLLWLLCLLGGISFGQTHTFPALDTTNTFTGSNTFSTLNGCQVIDGVTYALTTAGVQAAVTAMPANGGCIYVPPNTQINLTSAVTISKNISVVCGNRNTSTFSGPSGGYQFSFSGSVAHTEFQGCQFASAAGVADYSGITSQLDGRHIWRDGKFFLISGFGGDVLINLPSSAEFFTFEHNQVTRSVGMYIKDNTDSFIQDNEFEHMVSTPWITLEGGNVHITHNTFLYGSLGAGTSPDIQLKPRTATYLQSQHTFIDNNKFSIETEISSRNKILVLGDANTFWSGGTFIIGNEFGCVSGNKVIALQSAIHGWLIDENGFNDCSTLIDDTYTQVATDFGPASVFGARNFTLDPAGAASPLTMCTNGCRGFSEVHPPMVTSDTPRSDRYPRSNETQNVRNRITSSENFAAGGWSIQPSAGHITLTTGQTDPWGTTRATLLTRANTSGSEAIASAYDTTSITNQIVVKFWAKGNACSTLEATLFDSTKSIHLPEKVLLTLSTSNWNLYKINWAGVPTADVISLFLYPCGEPQVAGSVFLTAVQVSDIDTDYVQTTGSALTTAAGDVYNRTHAFNGNMTESALAGHSQLGASSTCLNASFNGGSFACLGQIATAQTWTAAQTYNIAPTSAGSAPTFTGSTGACASTSSGSGGSWAGQITCTGTTGASSLVVIPGTTAAHGWSCWGSDLTHSAAGSQSAVTTTSCSVFFGSVTANDVLTFGAIPY